MRPGADARSDPVQPPVDRTVAGPQRAARRRRLRRRQRLPDAHGLHHRPPGLR